MGARTSDNVTACRELNPLNLNLAIWEIPCPEGGTFPSATPVSPEGIDCSTTVSPKCSADFITSEYTGKDLLTEIPSVLNGCSAAAPLVQRGASKVVQACGFLLPAPDMRSRPDNCGAYMTETENTLGSKSHTVVMALKFGHAATNPSTRQWLLNIGQTGKNAEHWLYTPGTGSIQFGAWGHADMQVGHVDISQAQTLATVYDEEKRTYALYVDGEFKKEVDGVLLDIQSSSMAVGEKSAYTSNANFDGCSSGINIYLSPLTPEQVRATSKALLEEAALV